MKEKLTNLFNSGAKYIVTACFASFILTITTGSILPLVIPTVTFFTFLYITTYKETFSNQH